jgi:8-oxo-dGTP diphosphatase
MTRYCLGFAFSGSGEEVVLIQKRKPTWQAGKWNGVGGKVETGETSPQAMVREFKEETTVKTTATDWRQFASLGSKDWNVDVFCAFDAKFFYARTNTPEQVRVVPVDSIKYNLKKTLPNLAWLIPMALQLKDDASFAQATVQYLSVSDVE